MFVVEGLVLVSEKTKGRGVVHATPLLWPGKRGRDGYLPPLGGRASPSDALPFAVYLDLSLSPFLATLLRIHA